MGMGRLWLIGLGVLGLAGPALAADPKGDWLVNDKAAVIRVAPCAAALCGHIAWVIKPGGTDTNNPDPSKRNRPVLGLPILLNMQPKGNRWEGEVYNAKDGKIYASNIALRSDNVLRIEGCVLGFLCGGENWTRVKCDEVAPPAGPAGAARPAARTLVTACKEVSP
jgi:uncharacterized protein (DUF2147 family)